MSRLLVVNADDLGLTYGVNRAIRRAHLDGVVTSTSLLAVGTAFDDAAKMLQQTPSSTSVPTWPLSGRIRRC